MTEPNIRKRDLLFTQLPGIYANGIHCGIKANSNAKDLAYIYVPDAYGSAGVFTRNQFPASCVTHSRNVVSKHVAKAVIINSGNANAGTGKEGQLATQKMARLTASHLKLSASEVAVASTGKIGCQLPLATIESGIQTLLTNPLTQNGEAAAEAILTTDLRQKSVYYETTVGTRTLVVAGISKGSGMIAPNMATTLSFLVTNVPIDSYKLQKCLHWAIERSFNMISVDTDTSTNDMVLLFSSGSDRDRLTATEEWDAFEALLLAACIDLAKQIVQDGEGATKLIETHVTGATSITDAKTIAMNIINSPLVKTAIHGADPNWGRIVAAACRDPLVKINPQKLELTVAGTVLFAKGEPQPFNSEDVSSRLKHDTILISLNLHLGSSEATAWGCDLTKDYVDINTQYC